MITRRKSLRMGLAAGAGLLATRTLVGADAIRWGVVDRRNASSNTEYRLIFTARKSGNVIALPGHTYLVVGEYDHVKKLCRFDSGKIFGFYPAPDASDLKVMFGMPVPGVVQGKLKTDLDQGLITHRLDIQAAQNGYDEVEKVASIYAKENPYQMGNTDCVALVEAMLQALVRATRGATGKLVVPDKSRFQTPRDYLSELLKANGVG